MRFLEIGLADAVPDANTISTFREAVTPTRINSKRAVLFKRFDAAMKACGYLAMGVQIVDATIVATPKQRNTKRSSSKRSRKTASEKLEYLTADQIAPEFLALAGGTIEEGIDGLEPQGAQGALMAGLELAAGSLAAASVAA
jgi:hypothetical protein